MPRRECRSGLYRGEQDGESQVIRESKVRILSHSQPHHPLADLQGTRVKLETRPYKMSLFSFF
jgi:hypothetical protein